MDAGVVENSFSCSSSSESVDNLSDELKTLVTNGKNSLSLTCQRCCSVILRPHLAVFKQKQMELPIMRKKSESDSDSDREMIENCWLIDNMFNTFENVGFSHVVGTTKYLICADCEIGPIGWHDVNNKSEFYVALERVNHSE